MSPKNSIFQTKCPKILDDFWNVSTNSENCEFPSSSTLSKIFQKLSILAITLCTTPSVRVVGRWIGEAGHVEQPQGIETYDINKSSKGDCIIVKNHNLYEGKGSFPDSFGGFGGNGSSPNLFPYIK